VNGTWTLRKLLVWETTLAFSKLFKDQS